MNTVVLIGRLTADPELKYGSASQVAVARFTVAVDRVRRQNEEKKADFLRIVVFGKQAENCEKYLSKGRQVAVQGRIETGSYVNREGQTVYTTDIIAERVQFLEWRERDSAQGSYGGGSAGLDEGGNPSDPAKSGDDLPDSFKALTEDNVPF